QPPSTGIAPVRRRTRRPSPPPATVSRNVFVGRRKSTAVFALSIASSTLPSWASCIRSKYPPIVLASLGNGGGAEVSSGPCMAKDSEQLAVRSGFQRLY